MVDPAGPSAQAIAQVWWWMFGGAVLVFVAVVAVWLWAMRPGRPDRRGDDAERHGLRWIVGGGILLPTVVITLLLVFGWRSGLHQMPVSLAGDGPQDSAPMRVDVSGQQWFWTTHYPDSGVRLRNELRMPVGVPVEIHVGSEDVIHSFWVPRLGGKIDAIPGRTNRIRLQADRAGTFRGPCAEFCGTAHAHMAMVVHAMEPAEFSAWLAARAAAQGRGDE